MDSFERLAQSAFPVCEPEYRGGRPIASTNYPGLTRREYFAAQAMQALIAKSGDSWLYLDSGKLVVLCRNAYVIADGMLLAGEENADVED